MHNDLDFRNQLSRLSSEVAWTRPDGRKAFVPPLKLSDFGDPEFCREHGLRLPYMAGAMAHAIISVGLVVTTAQECMVVSL